MSKHTWGPSYYVGQDVRSTCQDCVYELSDAAAKSGVVPPPCPGPPATAAVAPPLAPNKGHRWKWDQYVRDHYCEDCFQWNKLLRGQQEWLQCGSIGNAQRQQMANQSTVAGQLWVAQQAMAAGNINAAQAARFLSAPAVPSCPCGAELCAALDGDGATECIKCQRGRG